MKKFPVLLLALAMAGCATPTPEVKTEIKYVTIPREKTEIPQQPVLEVDSISDCNSLPVETKQPGDETKASCAMTKLWASIEALELYVKQLNALLEASNK